MKVYWSKCGHGHGNFGDKITPLLLKQAGIPVEWSPPEHAELIGSGSVLEKARESFRGVVWSTGFMEASSRLRLPHARVLALRGALTLRSVEVENPSNIVLGDAGLLCGKLLPSRPRKKRKLGIIPHFVDIADPYVKALADRSSEIAVIDICGQPEDVMRSTAECENILSSSLHGLILAESLGIPNRWVELNRGPERVSGNGFKFRDYYSVFGTDPVPMQLQPNTTLDEALLAVRQTPPPRDLETIQAGLTKTLKEIKDSVRPASAEEVRNKRDAEREWWQRRTKLHTVVANTIPAGANVIVADGEQIRPSIVGVQTLPFMEREGQYWGPPGTAAEAIAEAQRQVGRGARWLIVAWPMFWMLEQFPEFSRHLSEKFTLQHECESARVFRVSQPVRPGRRKSVWELMQSRASGGAISAK